MENEIRQKDGFNMIMQQALIKLIWSSQHFVYTPNHKFDEILFIMDKTFDTLKAQALIANDYYKLTKKLNLIF